MGEFNHCLVRHIKSARKFQQTFSKLVMTSVDQGYPPTKDRNHRPYECNETQLNEVFLKTKTTGKTQK